MAATLENIQTQIEAI
jgi:septation ring formation regulator EzrA